MNIAYIAPHKIPNNRAHSYQIFENCQRMSEFANVTLLHSGKNKSFEAFYNKKPLFRSIKSIHGDGLSHFWSFSIFILKNFSKEHKKNKFDYIYVRDVNFSPIYILLKCIYKVPLIYENHRHSGSSIYNLLLKFILKCSDKRIYITNGLSNFFNKYPGIVLTCVVDEKLFLDNTNLPNPKFTVLYTGSLVAYQGINLLVDLAKKNPDINVVVVGGTGAILDEYRKDTVELNNIEFKGYVLPGEIPSYYILSSVLVIPITRDDIGASPMKLFEYLSSRRPIIASDTTPISEVVENNKDAILFKTGDYEAFEKAVIMIKNNKDLANDLAENSYKLRNKYTWKQRTILLKEFLS